MTEIYVVISQGNYMTGKKGFPIAAYSDYPSALNYAQSIFKKVLGSQETAKDLIFLITLSPSVQPTTTGTAAIGKS
jgi:hypothetical protein